MPAKSKVAKDSLIKDFPEMSNIFQNSFIPVEALLEDKKRGIFNG